MSMTSSLWWPATTLARCCCVLLLVAVLTLPAESADNKRRPYLLVQHQVYEEHQEVLGKDPLKHIASEDRKDDDELFDFVKDYLFKRGGAAKLRSRSGDGRAQFMGVNMGSKGGAGAAEGKGDGQSAGQRYKMHIVKFRLVNGSHHAAAAVRNAHGAQENTDGNAVEKYAYKQGDYMPQEARHKEQHHMTGSSDHNAHGGHREDSTSLTRLWGIRSSIGYRTAHPTHVKTTTRETPAKPPAASNMCELPTVVTSKRITSTTTKTTTTTHKPTTVSTTTRTTTTCAPTTVNVVGCDRPLPPSTTSSTTTTRSTTTTTAAASTTLKPYLHGHPYVVIKLHEVPGTPRAPVELVNLGSPLQPSFLLRKHQPRNGSESGRNASHHLSEHRHGSWLRVGGGGGSPSEAGDGHQHKDGEKHPHKDGEKHQHKDGEKYQPRPRRIPEYEAETAALKREVAGNLMRVLRTIRELDSVANGPPQQEQLRQAEETQGKLEQEEPQEQEVAQPAQLEEQLQERDSVYMAMPNRALDIDRLLMGRGNARGLKSMRRRITEYPDELKENRAEEGDLHQFSLLLRKALDELNVPSTSSSTTRTSSRTTSKTTKKKKKTSTESRKEFFGRR